MRRSRYLLLIGVAGSLACALLPTRGARAAEPTPSEISVARRLFDEGKAAEDAGRWSEAAEKFRQAAAIKDTPGIRFHLARCEEERGAVVEALVEYDRARELLVGGVKAPDVERLLPEARERVRVKVAQLTLRLADGVQNASIMIDGKPTSTSVLGAALPLNPGRHRVQASAPGRAPFDKELSLGSGESRELRLELPVLPASTAPAAAPPRVDAPSPERPVARDESDTSPARTIVLVSEGSLLLATVGAGIYFTVARSSAQTDMQKANNVVLASLDYGDTGGTACSMPTKPELIDSCGDLDRARQDRERAAKWQVVSFVGAGVSAAALGLTWWLWPSTSAARPAVSASPGRLDLSLSGSF